MWKLSSSSGDEPPPHLDRLPRHELGHHGAQAGPSAVVRERSLHVLLSQQRLPGQTQRLRLRHRQRRPRAISRCSGRWLLQLRTRLRAA